MRHLVALALLLASCGTDGAPPALLPLDDLRAAIPPATEDPGEALAARGDGLRARAAGLHAAAP